MQCPKCKHENENDSVVCRNCGAILPVEGSKKTGASIRVSVVDIDMPFLSMVNFLVKLTIAAIPAAIVVTILVVFFGGILAAVFHR